MTLAYDQLAAIRLGFGLSPRVTGPSDPAGVAASVSAAAPGPDAVRTDQVRSLQREARLLKRDSRDVKDGALRPDRAHRQRMRSMFDMATLDRFARAVDDPSGFGERLVWFWADHFTISGGTINDNVMSLAFIDDAIRPHLAGRFSDLMFAAETHPSMLRYLDQARAMGPNSALALRKKDKPGGLNENLAREMIELHSLGVGADYSQQDIEQLAALLTGLTYNPQHETVFRAIRAEPGAETVLGKSYGGGTASLDDIRAVIYDLAAHPDTARHIARKMAAHFIADDPPVALVDRLAAVFVRTDGDLSAMNLALAEAPELATHLHQKVRQPFEFLVACLRSLGLDGAQIRAFRPADLQAVLMQPMAVMGQPWARPPGPDGWPEDARIWASPQGLAMRINWAMTQPARLARPLPDARGFLRSTLGDSASEALAWAVPRAESQTEGVALVLASADFNRR